MKNITNGSIGLFMVMYKLTFSKIQIGSGTADILLKIGDSVGVDEFVSFDISGKFIKELSRDISRLVKNKLIEIRKESGKLFLRLTDSGFTEFLKLKLSQSKKLPKNKGCLVVFDIPEKQKSQRKILRKFLKKYNFFPIQKSVWISSFDSTVLLNMFFRHVDFDRWVRVFTIDLG